MVGEQEGKERGGEAAAGYYLRCFMNRGYVGVEVILGDDEL